MKVLLYEKLYHCSTLKAINVKFLVKLITIIYFLMCNKKLVIKAYII